ncbi:dnaJ homolog subfamily C member 24 isoform X2 [Entelurus aequoreus]|uniref:dnaJ homolog subfamily C member 24 isoform X2 n=1 Tax=Entelurus aequoreus TaxID=161455 RepID=UPI002B1D426D|nr:dnaJ homolog subfamily C member 24 isoform X2 [Entelurus aequoreus]
MANGNLLFSDVSDEKDHYAVLGACPSDSLQELRHRYKKLALQCHPDRLGGSEAKSGLRMFLEIDAAWRILSDDSTRSHYDQRRREEGVYSYSCRCGGQFSITQEEIDAEMLRRQGAAKEEDTMEGHHWVVCCDTCSLSVYMTFPSNSTPISKYVNN